MIFSDAVIDKLRNIFQITIVVLSISFKIAEFHGFPLHPLGLVTFAVKILRFLYIFTQSGKVWQQGIVVLNLGLKKKKLTVELVRKTVILLKHLGSKVKVVSMESNPTNVKPYEL